jgi:Ca2+-binding EF-hand superfamily protein
MVCSHLQVGELLATLGTNLDQDELEKLVKIMDKDGSGEISLDELAAVMLSKKQMSSKVSTFCLSARARKW